MIINQGGQMDKLYIAAGILIATLLIFIGGIWLGSYMKVNEYDKTARVNQSKQQEALLKLEKENTKREADYEKRIENIKKAIGDCLDQSMPDIIIDELQSSSRGSDRPQTHGRLRSASIGR